MSRIGLLSVSALALVVAGSIWTAPNVFGQMFVGTPAPAQYTGPAQPSTKNGEWPTNAGDNGFADVLFGKIGDFGNDFLGRGIFHRKARA